MVLLLLSFAWLVCTILEMFLAEDAYAWKLNFMLSIMHLILYFVME